MPNFSSTTVRGVSIPFGASPTLDEDKTYYAYDSTNDAYSEVLDPDVSDIATYYEQSEGNPSTLGYYEFTGQLDATVQNYIASHIAMTDDGLWITKDGESCHLLIAAGRLSFRGTDGSEVAYIAIDPETNQSTFYMTKAVVMKELRFGKWMWYGRPNGNMALKWVG